MVTSRIWFTAAQTGTKVRLPSADFAKRHALVPFGVTNRYSPPPSATFWGFVSGLIARILVSVSGMARTVGISCWHRRWYQQKYQQMFRLPTNRRGRERPTNPAYSMCCQSMANISE
jgi:hypothetical protein